MKLTSSLAAGLAKMESKLTGSNHHGSAGDCSVLENGSTISMNQELIDCSPSKFGSTNAAQSTAILVARIISRTLLLITLIIGFIILLSAYIQSKSYCALEYESQPQALFQTDSRFDHDGSASSVQPNIPISIRMNGKAGDLMNVGPGEKGQVNCLIERKTANQIIASEPKKLMTPFGNITTDPKLIHLTGEKLMFSCHSGEKELDINNSNLEKDEEPEKPIKRLIIISGIKTADPIESGNPDRENEIQAPPSTPPMINRDEIAKPVVVKNNLRSKRQVINADSLIAAPKKKECSCNCAC